MNKLFRIWWWVRLGWMKLTNFTRDAARRYDATSRLYAVAVSPHIEGSLVDATEPVIGQKFVIDAWFANPDFVTVPIEVQTVIADVSRSVKETTGSLRFSVKVMVPKPSSVTINVGRVYHEPGGVVLVGSLYTELTEAGYHKLVVFVGNQTKEKKS